MKAEIINSFILAAHRVLDKKLNVAFEVGKVRLKEPETQFPDINYRVDLSGGIRGSVMFGLPFKLTDLLSALPAHNTKNNNTASNRTKSGVRIVSLITGTAKKELESKDIILSPPQIIPNMGSPKFPAAAPVITIPINTGKGNMIIDISYEEHRQDQGIIDECL